MQVKEKAPQLPSNKGIFVNDLRNTIMTEKSKVEESVPTQKSVVEDKKALENSTDSPSNEAQEPSGCCGSCS